jgi:hypothetical protein
LANGRDRAGDGAAHYPDGRALSFLVSLPAANGDPQPCFAFLDILAIEGDDLRTAESASKAEQE